MGSDSDSTSDLDEDLPIYDFLQPGRSQASQTHKPDLVVLDSSDTEVAVSSSPFSATDGAVGGLDAGIAVAEVMTISSEEEEDVPYVPLALRLKQRQESLKAASSTATNGKDAPDSPSDRPCSDLLAQNGHSESEPLFPSYHALTSHQRIEHGGRLDGPEEATLPQLWPPPKPSSWAGSTTTSPAKSRPSKRTPEEILAARQEALRRREAKERQQGDKEAQRLEQERQKAERKALADAAKALRPEECVRHMVVCVDPALLLLEGGCTLLPSLQALGCSCAIEKQPVPRSVSWIRRYPCTQTGEEVSIPEAQTVVQMPVDDFISLTHSYAQEQRGGRTDCGPSLTSWVLALQARNPSRTPSLVVMELEKYFRSQKSQSQKKFREAVLGEEQKAGKKRRRKDGGEALPEVSRLEVEEALVHLQLHTGVQVRFLSTWKEFSDHITMTTKAVAEAPFKREREKTSFSFYLESEWAGGQKADKAGKGLLQVWRRQIQQLNRVSPDMASAILATYPSPQLLNQAYGRCRSEREKLSLLSDLLIRRGEGVTSTTRRVGPELSKRLFLLMTSSNPEQTVDSTA